MPNSLQANLTVQSLLPQDHAQAALVGRIWVQGTGPVLVRVMAEGVYDLSGVAPTCSQLLELTNPADQVRAATGKRIADTATVLANSAEGARDPALPWFLAPCDLQAFAAKWAASQAKKIVK